jgi:hypothetical protein
MPAPVGNRTGLPRIITALMAVLAVGLPIAIVVLSRRLTVGPREAFIIRPSVVAWIVILVAVALLLGWLIFRVHRLDLSLLGLSGATSLPAIPIALSQLPGTILRLEKRNAQVEQAVDGLSTVWTIGDITTNAYTFMGMGYSSQAERDRDPRTRLALTHPQQFAMGWTTLDGIYEKASREWLATFAASLDNAAEATKQFWPTIARFGLAYNLIILQRVDAQDGRLKTALGADWTSRMEAVWQAGNLYAIDMTFFARFPANVVEFQTRFTPGTLTLLERDPVSRAITPFAVRVSNAAGTTVQYADGDPAWLYALQAAKTSIAVWGIWIGHVYHWHIVTAAMQMTMFQELSRHHPVYQAFGRQSDYLIAFDQFLLLDWSIAPPTSVTSSKQFLQMINAFAEGRSFFDDDPQTTIDCLDLRMEDFTHTDDWDEYPVVRYLLALFAATATYVDRVVEAFYPDDASVAADGALQQWIAASGAARGGNVRGLPAMTTRTALKRVLTSLIYRVTAHGSSRLNQAANPGLTFAANFPPCLQSTTHPAAKHADRIQDRRVVSS